ncbi:MAG: PEP-CTERM sorting domain-containing protein, partial [Verrucomicrobia bacterium]|nr:PEP-CTERM sorting domain-containing protein [Verrucomicrobiota bacterium]
TFTIEFDVDGTQDVGLILRNPPSIGTSFDDVWVNTNDSGDWATRNIPLATANLAAQVGAVPEPSTIAFTVIGALALCGAARRRK